MLQTTQETSVPNVCLDQFERFLGSIINPFAGLMRDRFANEQFLYKTLFFTDAERSYENDGNTPCPGSRFDMLVVMPVARGFHDDWQEKDSWYRGEGDSCIYFHQEMKLRDRDKRIERNFTDLSVHPFNYCDDSRKTNIRPACCTNGIIRLNSRTIVRVCELVESIIRANNMNDEIQNFLGKEALSQHDTN